VLRQFLGKQRFGRGPVRRFGQPLDGRNGWRGASGDQDFISKDFLLSAIIFSDYQGVCIFKLRPTFK